MLFFDEYLGRTQLLIIGVFLVVFVFWWVFVKPLSYWKNRGIPCIPAVPFTGSMPLCFWRAHVGDVFSRMYSQLEGKRFGGFHKLSKPSMLIRDPEIIRDVLENSFDSFHDNDFESTAEIDSVYDQNLAFLRGDAWERLRGNIAPAFSSGNVKSLVPLILEVCETLEDCVSTKVDSVLELKETGQCYMADVISSIAFGTRGDSLLNPGGKFRRMGCKISDTSLLRFLLVKVLGGAPRLLRALPFVRVSPRAVAFFRGMVEEAIKLREEEKVKRADFLHILAELQKEGKLGTSEEESEGKEGKGDSKQWNDEALNNVTVQALAFFINGMNTTANTISFCLMELAHNPDIQDKARSEVEKALEFHGSMSFEALQDMSYLETVLLETVRKYPPSAFISRLTTRRYLLPSPEFDGDEEKSEEGVWLEEGSSVTIPVLGIHRDPQYYPNPDIFDPEHFSDKSLGKRSRFTFLGFGKGPRICIGMKLGLLQVKAAVATLLSKYEFLPSEKTSLPVIFNPTSVTITSKGGMWVKVASLKKKF